MRPRSFDAILKMMGNVLSSGGLWEDLHMHHPQRGGRDTKGEEGTNKSNM